MGESGYLSTIEAAEYCRVSEATFRKLLADPELQPPFYKVGNQHRFKANELDAWAASRGNPLLDEESSPDEVWNLGLRFFKWAIPQQIGSQSPNMTLMNTALKWLSTLPVDLPDDDKEELTKMMQETGVTPLHKTG